MTDNDTAFAIIHDFFPILKGKQEFEVRKMIFNLKKKFHLNSLLSGEISCTLGK
jgi:hypothetical protein